MTDISSDTNGALGVDLPQDTVVVRAACDTNNRQRTSVDYNFPKPNYTCEWEKDGNLSKRNEYLQARIEQVRQLAMAPNTILCDVKFKFETQKFLYDDHFLVTFNNAVIASSFDFSSQLNSQYGMLRYDWSKIAGIFWDKKKEGTFCAGGGTCSWPDTDIAGEIKMSYPSLMFQKLMAEDINRTNHEIKFVSIGDNDDKDCEHSNIDFTMEIEYVSK